MKHLSLRTAALMLVGAFIITACTDNASLVGPEVTGAITANSASGDRVCPDGTDGWQKINVIEEDDPKYYEVIDDFGTFNFTPASLNYNVKGGYALELCIKSATVKDSHYITGPANGNLTHSENKDISHVSWRVFGNGVDELERFTGQTSLEVYGVEITEAARESANVKGTFTVENVSSGDAWAQLTGASVSFEAIGPRRFRKNIGASSCTFTPNVNDPVGYWLNPMETTGSIQIFSFDCTLNEAVPTEANELRALVTVNAAHTDAHGRKFVKVFSDSGTFVF
jgi:hypothetical protein